MRELYNHSMSIISEDIREKNASKLSIAGQQKNLDNRKNRPRVLEPMLDKPTTPIRFNSMFSQYTGKEYSTKISHGGRNHLTLSPQQHSLVKVASKELVYPGPPLNESGNVAAGMKSLKFNLQHREQRMAVERQFNLKI